LVNQLWDDIAHDKTQDDATRDKKIKLAQDVWDSIPDDEAFVLTPELKAELDRRLADYEANPNAGCSWEEVKARLEAEL
jgi:putative addiction module component (TIGR02574 family)